MKYWDSAGVVAVVLVMDVMRVIAVVERDVCRGVGVDPSEQGDSGGPMVVDSWIETCCCLDGKCGYFCGDSWLGD